MTGVERGWDGREPIFRDTPFEESEWAGLYAVLRQVNQPKAELMRVQYEAVRVAYQHFVQAREQEQLAYAARREADEAYNRIVDEQRQHLIAQMESVRCRWQAEIDRLRRELEAADVEAYRRAARAGMNLRGDPMLGIGLDLPDGNAPTASTNPSAPDASANPSPMPNAPTASATAHEASARGFVSDTLRTPAEPPAPLTEAEAAHAAHLPTATAPPLPNWLQWAALVVMGLALGQVLLMLAGQSPSAWQSLAFWIASLAGVVMMVVWYRAVWGASRAVSELYYLFDWQAAKAKRAAWLGGTLIGLLLVLPLGLLLLTLLRLPSTTADAGLIGAFVVGVGILPLLGLALVSGYVQGRAAVVQNAVQSAVVAAQRAGHASPEPRSTAPATPAASAQDSQRPSNDVDASAAAPDGASTYTPRNGDAREPASARPETAPSRQQRLEEAFEAIAYARGIYANFNRARALMQEELLPYEQLLREMQRRPIYDYLPPEAAQRLHTLYAQWRDAYNTFLNYVAEAMRECKDGEQIQQRIHDFQQALLR